MGKYVKKTNRRRYEDRNFSVRAVHREVPETYQEPAGPEPGSKKDGTSHA